MKIFNKKSNGIYNIKIGINIFSFYDFLFVFTICNMYNVSATLICHDTKAFRHSFEMWSGPAC
jgi:hypothetical protein